MDSKAEFGDLVSGKAIVERTGKKVKELSPEELDDVVNKLAIGIYNSILHWSPDIVILGGAVIIDTPDLVPKLQKKVASLLKIFPEAPLFKKAALEDKSALWGALKLSEPKK